MEKPYFNPAKVPNPVDRYVAWIDLMGTKNLMTSSLKVLSVALFKVHVAALDAKKALRLKNIQLFPVMDGIYVSCEDVEDLKRFIKYIFWGLSKVFIDDRENHRFQFLIRGAVSKGQIYHGEDLLPNSAKRLDENPEYKKSIIIGMPVASAYLSEPSAPPFGIEIHESAKSGFELRQGEHWWRWFGEDFDSAGFYEQLRFYFDWHRQQNGVAYPQQKINEHDAFARQYFVGWQ